MSEAAIRLGTPPTATEIELPAGSTILVVTDQYGQEYEAAVPASAVSYDVNGYEAAIGKVTVTFRSADNSAKVFHLEPCDPA